MDEYHPNMFIRLGGGSREVGSTRELLLQTARSFASQLWRPLLPIASVSEGNASAPVSKVAEDSRFCAGFLIFNFAVLLIL